MLVSTSGLLHRWHENGVAVLIVDIGQDTPPKPGFHDLLNPSRKRQRVVIRKTFEQDPVCRLSAEVVFHKPSKVSASLLHLVSAGRGIVMTGAIDSLFEYLKLARMRRVFNKERIDTRA
jgi:hypothetical protein